VISQLRTETAIIELSGPTTIKPSKLQRLPEDGPHRRNSLPTRCRPRMPRRRKSTVQRHKGRAENGSPLRASRCNAAYRKLRREQPPARITRPSKTRARPSCCLLRVKLEAARSSAQSAALRARERPFYCLATRNTERFSLLDVCPQAQDKPS